MIPLVEVLNGEILNEPGAWFKKEKLKIKSSIQEDLDLEEAKEDLKLKNLSKGRDYDLKELKENFANALFEQDQIGDQIT